MPVPKDAAKAERMLRLREHGQGKHPVVRLDCPACRKFAGLNAR